MKLKVIPETISSPKTTASYHPTGKTLAQLSLRHQENTNNFFSSNRLGMKDRYKSEKRSLMLCRVQPAKAKPLNTKTFQLTSPAHLKKSNLSISAQTSQKAREVNGLIRDINSRLVDKREKENGTQTSLIFKGRSKGKIMRVDPGLMEVAVCSLLLESGDNDNSKGQDHHCKDLTSFIRDHILLNLKINMVIETMLLEMESQGLEPGQFVHEVYQNIHAGSQIHPSSSNQLILDTQTSEKLQKFRLDLTNIANTQ